MTKRLETNLKIISTEPKILEEYIEHLKLLVT